jgi:hypothetical protein
MIRRNILTIVIFILSCSACFLLSLFAGASCEAILHYTWTVQFGIGGIVFSLIRMFIIWVAGMTVWFLIRRKIKSQNYKRIKFFYFALLPLLIFYKQLEQISGNIIDQSMERSICDKTTSNGMTTSSKKLTLPEYDHLKINLPLLPALPLTAEKINISYYTDDFLGDYTLSVQFECDIHEPIDTSLHRWWVDAVDSVADKKEVTYETGAG